MKRIKRIKVPIAYLRDNIIIEIESDLVDVYKAYAELLAKRYARSKRNNFISSKDLEDKRKGVTGQLMFQSILIQWMIPHIPDNPAFEFKEHRVLWDFIIPNFGSVEVKTFHTIDRYFMVKKELWLREIEDKREPDYVIALRLLDDSKAKIEGWLYGYEVEKLQVSEKESKLTPYASAYYCRFEKLHPFSELLPKLKACCIGERI
jgi:hypothetical protein